MVNPYQPPPRPSEQTELAEDIGRRALAATIQLFLRSEITAHQLVEKLEPFLRSEDPLVEHVTESIWYYYDDCSDHLVCLDKSEWDYLQRLLLALHSNATITTKSEVCWSVKQLIAAVSLAVFVYLAVQVGWGEHLLILAIPFGIVSIALSSWRTDEPATNPYEPIIYPFASFADLAAVYRQSDFRKTRFPKHLEQRSIRSSFMSAFWTLHGCVIWLIFSPIPLAFQVFPESRSEARIFAA